MPELELRGVTAGYGSVEVLHGASIVVREGEIVTIIGANGAGKTTLIKSICSLIPWKTGEVIFDGQYISGLPSEAIVSRGIVCVPEGRMIFSPLTVLDNLRLGHYTNKTKDRKRLNLKFEQVFTLFPILFERRNKFAGLLSGGEQQMLAIGRALMAEPKLLLLDEPSLGLAPLVVDRIYNVLQELHMNGLPMLLVEQNASLALSIASRGYVLDVGNVIMHDTGRALLANQRVRQIYLGEDAGGASYEA